MAVHIGMLKPKISGGGGLTKNLFLVKAKN